MIVNLPGGATTHVEQWGERGPALICVHGITSSRMGWRRFAERFAPHFRVYAYDQRGHGDSAGITERMSLRDNVDDLKAVIAAIDPPIAALIGHSWGGAVVILGGREIDVPKIVAVDPLVLADAEFPWRQTFIEPLERDWPLSPEERERAHRERFADLHPLDLEGKLHALREMGPKALEAMAYENRIEAGGWDLRETLRDYPKPLLIPVPDPEGSVIEPPELAFIHKYGGPHVKVQQFPGAGHSIHRSQLDALAAAIEQFLDEPLPRQQAS